MLYALEAACGGEFTPTQQLFIGGVAQELVERCGAPGDPGDRAKLAGFLSSSLFVAGGGRNYMNPDLGETMGGQGAYMAGVVLARQVDCQGAAPTLLSGVVTYLDSGPDRFVSGCVDHYAGQYSRSQCQCVADVGRAIYPNIHATPFSRRMIGSIVESNPIVGLQLAVQCGIGDY